VASLSTNFVACMENRRPWGVTVMSRENGEISLPVAAPSSVFPSSCNPLTLSCFLSLSWAPSPSLLAQTELSGSLFQILGHDLQSSRPWENAQSTMLHDKFITFSPSWPERMWSVVSGSQHLQELQGTRPGEG
jgi:hypothetical protein